ncbi:hypothetical protein Rsub_08153 [Raphidocelis subcapitata]|uniref:Uncharacterized protein n=1 Tax=Raphidocelis subcapitata TaxID=307507 RepID=A0A2V0PAL9_9CHLO|nr:hypothetical protein Rsub_08153 [Raphidocelis subcapitata]|eukprot:GBF94910.1 hypothetical protein Rsub_08153 [Raphidocelis subcapitata]
MRGETEPTDSAEDEDDPGWAPAPRPNHHQRRHAYSWLVLGERYRRLKQERDALLAERNAAVAKGRRVLKQRDEALTHLAEALEDVSTCKLLMEASRRLEGHASHAGEAALRELDEAHAHLASAENMQLRMRLYKLDADKRAAEAARDAALAAAAAAEATVAAAAAGEATAGSGGSQGQERQPSLGGGAAAFEGVTAERAASDALLSFDDAALAQELAAVHTPWQHGGAAAAASPPRPPVAAPGAAASSDSSGGSPATASGSAGSGGPSRSPSPLAAAPHAAASRRRGAGAPRPTTCEAVKASAAAAVVAAAAVSRRELSVFCQAMWDEGDDAEGGGGGGSGGGGGGGGGKAEMELR